MTVGLDTMHTGAQAGAAMGPPRTNGGATDRSAGSGRRTSVSSGRSASSGASRRRAKVAPALSEGGLSGANGGADDAAGGGGVSVAMTPTSAALRARGGAPAFGDDSTSLMRTPPRDEAGGGGGVEGAAEGGAAASEVPRDSPATVQSARSSGSRGRVPNLGCCGNRHHHKVATKFRLLRDDTSFQAFIILVIFVAGIQVGIQTYPVDPDSKLAEILDVTDEVVMAIFILEIVIKVIAEGAAPWLFFTDSWNCFDFGIVAVGLLPIGGGSAVTALRLIRLLRVLKLVRALPKLRLLVMGLLQSMSSIAYIGLLLGMLFYLYAVVGVSMFGENDPLNMGSLHITLLTLFRCATLEDWSDIMYTATTGCDHWGYEGKESFCVASTPKPFLGVLYFASFVVLANMMILNLFIGVITTSMAEAKVELEEEMVVEAKEKERQRRLLLGLPSESEADDGDLDDAIRASVDRIQYLLRKATAKTVKFEDAVTAVVASIRGESMHGSPASHKRVRRVMSDPSMRRTGSGAGALDGSTHPVGGGDRLNGGTSASPLPKHMRLRTTTARSLPERAAGASARSPAGHGTRGKPRWQDQGPADGSGLDSDASPLDGSVSPVRVVDLAQLRAIGRGASAATMSAFDVDGFSPANARAARQS